MKMGSTVRGALSYNEQKVYNGKAKLLLASGFACDIESLGFSEKFNRFQKLNERYPKLRTNTLHLSINFPPDEEINDEKMRKIAVDYMNRIGFGEQPFLVYKHTDTKHQHFHIVTTCVQADNEAINMNFLGRDKSEPARKAIEQEYGLIIAESRKQQLFMPGNRLTLRPSQYGAEESKHAITNIVNAVLQSYKFSSFDEFNSILRQFRVVAERGKPGSRLYENGGLVYSLLDKSGYKMGVAIKASKIYGEPILARIERRFPGNAVKKAALVPQLLGTARAGIARSSTAQQFLRFMRRNQVDVHFDNDRTGMLQKVYFIDHKAKGVFSHVDLSISLDEICRLRNADIRITQEANNAALFGTQANKTDAVQQGNGLGTWSTSGMMQILLRPVQSPSAGSGPTPKKKKKKRRGPAL